MQLPPRIFLLFLQDERGSVHEPPNKVTRMVSRRGQLGTKFSRVKEDARALTIGELERLHAVYKAKGAPAAGSTNASVVGAPFSKYAAADLNSGTNVITAAPRLNASTPDNTMSVMAASPSSARNSIPVPPVRAITSTGSRQMGYVHY